MRRDDLRARLRPRPTSPTDEAARRRRRRRYDVAVARARRRGLRDPGRVLARRGRRSARARSSRRCTRRVLAARLALRPAHRQAHRPPGHRAGRHLPRRGPTATRRLRRHHHHPERSTTPHEHPGDQGPARLGRDRGRPQGDPQGRHADRSSDGETHAIMGPNGSGKSTLAYSIAGHPKYDVTGGTVTLDGVDVLAMTVDERARAGLFLAMQYPVEVPGVSVSNFLRTAKTALDGEAPKLRTWVKDVNAAMEQLNLDPTFGTAQRQRGLLRRREEAPRDRPARAAQPEVRDPRRDRLRPRHRRAQDRRRGRQPVPRAGGQGRPADHPLHADPALHQARLRARLRRRPDRRAGRPRAGRAARGRGLRQVPAGRLSSSG